MEPGDEAICTCICMNKIQHPLLKYVQLPNYDGLITCDRRNVIYGLDSQTHRLTDLRTTLILQCWDCLRCMYCMPGNDQVMGVVAYYPTAHARDHQVHVSSSVGFISLHMPINPEAVLDQLK